MERLQRGNLNLYEPSPYDNEKLIHTIRMLSFNAIGCLPMGLSSCCIAQRRTGRVFGWDRLPGEFGRMGLPLVGIGQSDARGGRVVSRGAKWLTRASREMRARDTSRGSGN